MVAFRRTTGRNISPGVADWCRPHSATPRFCRALAKHRSQRTVTHEMHLLSANNSWASIKKTPPERNVLADGTFLIQSSSTGISSVDRAPRSLDDNHDFFPRNWALAMLRARGHPWQKYRVIYFQILITSLIILLATHFANFDTLNPKMELVFSCHKYFNVFKVWFLPSRWKGLQRSHDPLPACPKSCALNVAPCGRHKK